MARTVGLTFGADGKAAAPEPEEKEVAAVAEGKKTTDGKRLTKAEVIEILTEKGIEFDKKAKLEDLMKLLNEDEEKDGDGNGE